jgi:hypothetical protein
MEKAIGAACAGLVALAFGSVSATAQPQAQQGLYGCFHSIDFESWKAVDDQTMYLHIRGNRYFRVDLANKCFMLKVPNAHLITIFRGPDLICSAVDWDLKVSQDIHDIPEPCIVKSMQVLTPAEAAAIPPKFKPP